MSKTVGILNFHYVYNYGAVLQAAALSRAIRSLGYDPINLDYRPGNLAKASRPFGLRAGRPFSTHIWRCKFDKFRQRHIPQTHKISSLKELERFAEHAHAVVVGSDQVWNMHLVKPFDGALFLDFAFAATCRRISYAACFGRVDQPADLLEHVREPLSRFHALSVRNKLSQQVVRSVIGKSPPVVLDPTLLIDIRDLRAKAIPREPYIVVYGLLRENSDGLAVALREVREATKLPAVAISQMWDVPGADKYEKKVGPAEWLSLIANASYVVTDSFHGSAFAIAMSRPLIGYLSDWRSGRLVELCERYGLNDRLVTASTVHQAGLIARKVTDYDNVAKVLREDRENSQGFLHNALSSPVP